MVKKITLLLVTLSIETALAGNVEDVLLPMEKHREAEAPGEMEEITVYGQKSLLNLERAVIEAEDEVFALFNTLNTDNQFDIRCYKEAPLGSHIKHRICYPNYVLVLMDDAASVWSAGTRMNDFPGGQPMINIVKKKKKEKKLHEIWGSLAAEHPEMLNALKTHSEAKKTYASEREKRCERLLITCQESK
jgi:hypothetical protein